MADSKDVYGTLINDKRFWDQDVPTRLEIIDFAANKNVRDDMPEAELMQWSRNRFNTRALAKLGVEEFNKGVEQIRAAPDGPMPEQFSNPDVMSDIAGMSQLPYGKDIVLSPTSDKPNGTINALSTGVGAPQEVQIPTGDGDIKLKFVPHPTKFLLDIATSNGIKRHQFDNFEEVPKDGLSMTRFLSENYATDFDIDESFINEAGAQAKGVGKRIASEAVKFIANVPTAFEMTKADVLMGDKGYDFARQNTIDSDGNVIPMSKDLKDTLWKEAEMLHRDALSQGGTNDQMGFGGGKGITIEDAFIKAHKQHLDAIGPIEVTGTPSKTPRENGIDADERFAVLEKIKYAGDPRNSIDRARFLKTGDKVTASDLLAAHVALADAPKAKVLAESFEKHLGNIRTIDEIYGDSAKDTIRASRDGVVQKALNFQQDAAGVVGQMLPVIPAAILTGPLVAAEAGALSQAVGYGLALAPSAATGFSGSMMESVSSVFQDDIQSGKTPQEAILNATDAGIASAMVSTPIDMAGDAALMKVFSNFGKAYRALPAKSQEHLAKNIARLMKESAGEGGKGVMRQALEGGLMQAVSETAGEFTRAQVADLYRDNPEGASSNLKQALYEGALAFAGTFGMATGNAALSDGWNAFADWKLSKRMDDVGVTPDRLKDIMKLAPDARNEALQAHFDVKQDNEAQGVPPLTVSGAPVVPVRQGTKPATTPITESQQEFELEARQEAQVDQQATEAFSAAPITDDQSEIDSLSALNITPGDIIKHNGTAVRVLGAPISADGSSVAIRGVTPDGRGIVIPEADLGDVEHITVNEGTTIRDRQDAEENVLDVPELPPSPTPEAPEVAASPAPVVTFGDSQESVAIVPETIDFAKSRGITPADFSVSGTGVTITSKPSARVNIKMAEPAGAEVRAVSGPVEITRNYDQSVSALNSWARWNNHQPVSTQALGDFMASNGINPAALIGESNWSAMGQYVNDLPVMMVDRLSDPSLSAINIRFSNNSGGTLDGVVIPMDKWESMTPARQATTLVHEVLHSSISDWAESAQGEFATSDMTALAGEVQELGDAFFKSVKAANTPVGKAFRRQFGSIFDNGNYNPENPHELIEELLIRGLTDHRARTVLQSVTPDFKPLDAEATAYQPSLWDKIMDLFRRMVGRSGTAPAMESMFDRFVSIHQRMNDQRATATLAPTYGTREAAKIKAMDLGLPNGSYTIDGKDGSFKILLGDMAAYREAQKQLDQAARIARVFATEQDQSVLDASLERFVSAQKFVASRAEGLLARMAEPDAATLTLSPEDAQAAADATIESMQRSGEANLSNRFVLGPALPNSIVDELTQSGRNQAAFLKETVDAGVQAWGDGFRSFASWQAKLSEAYPNAPFISIWDRLQKSVAEVLSDIGANGVVSFKFNSADPANLARQEEYKRFLKNPSAEGSVTFFNEALQATKTKVSKPSRDALFTFGPMAVQRNRMIGFRKENDRWVFSFDETAYKREYDAASANAEENKYRLRELDTIPEAVREAKERIKGSRKAKAQMQNIFTDLASRVGIDKTGANHVWNEVRMPRSITSPEMNAAIEGAIERATNQFSLTPTQIEKARTDLRAYAKEAKKAFRKAHLMSPERILNEPRAKEIADASRAHARKVGNQHGFNVAAAVLTYGDVTNVEIEESFFELASPAGHLIQRKPFPIESQPGFSADIIQKLLGNSLDYTYQRAFIEGARSAFLRSIINDVVLDNEAVSKANGLWVGEAAPEGTIIGGIDFSGRNLFDALIDPMFEAVRVYGNGQAMRNAIATDGTFQKISPKDAQFRKSQLRKQYDSMVKGEQGKDADKVRADIVSNLMWHDPVFLRSFDPEGLGVGENPLAPEEAPPQASDVTNSITPGNASRLLKDIQDLRGALRTNTDPSFVNNLADFSNSQEQSTRSERRNQWTAANEKRQRKDDFKLKLKQTEALLVLTNGDKPAATALARQLIAASVNDSGIPSYDRVTELIEDQLFELAGNENNAATLRQKPLQAIAPRIERMVPLSPQRVRLALADSGAEMSNMADIIEMFSLMSDSPLGSVLGSFLRGNTRPLPVLLLDTQRMSEESRQAFRESGLLRNGATARQPGDIEVESDYQGEFLVVDVGQIQGDKQTQTVNRILAEAIRDQLAQEGTRSLNTKAEKIVTSLNDAIVTLDHGLQTLQRDMEGDQLLEHINNELVKVSDKWGGFNKMGSIPLAIEILSNNEFRQSLSMLPPRYFPVVPRVAGGIGRILNEKAREIASSDLNEASRKMLDFGLSFDEVADEADFGNIGEAFQELQWTTGNPLIDDVVPDTFASNAISNAMELLWTANQIAEFDGFADQSQKFQTNLPIGASTAVNSVEAGVAGITLNENDETNDIGTEMMSQQIQVAGAVVRSLKARLGKTADQWTNDILEAGIEDDAQELPGTSPAEVAQAYKAKAMADPTNPLFTGNTTKEADPEVRRSMAKVYAQEYWQTMMGGGALRPILADIMSKPYSAKWMQDNPQKELEDLAEFIMRPTTSKGVQGRVWASVARGFASDPGVTPERLADLNLYLLHDEWRKITGADMATRFLTGARFVPASINAGGPMMSLKNFAHNDAIYRIYGAASPALMDNILDTMGLMEFGATGTRGHVGFRSKMIGYEDRFRKLSAPLGVYRNGFVRATLAGQLTQYNLNATAEESVAKMLTELERGYANLVTSGKPVARRSYNLRKIYRKEMDRFVPVARKFASGQLTQKEYEIEIEGLLKPQELTWLKDVREMFNEVRPSMEVASSLLGRKMGSIANYIPMMNGRINDDMGFVDQQFRPVGEKVGTSRARSTNQRFVDGTEDVQYMLDLDGSQLINMLRRDVFMMETVQSGLLLHHVLGTENDKGGRYEGSIESLAKENLSFDDQAGLWPTLQGLRTVYDRTRTGFQSGINIDNRTRRILTTVQQIGAYKTLADLEQIPKQTIPGIMVYTARILANLASGDPGHLRSALSVANPLKGQTRANMKELMLTLAPSIALRGADGNAAFKEKLSLELKEPINRLTDIAGITDHITSLGLGAIRFISRWGLDLTVGKPDGLLTSNMFFTEYARRASKAGLSFDQAFEKANWNPRWAREAKAASEQIMGTSSMEERGSVMQMKGSSVSSEFLATTIRAYGIHNISLAAHARALANEIIHAPSPRQKLVAAGKLAEIGVQQAIFNAMSKPLRDLILAHMISSIPGVEKDPEDIYEWLLNEWPLDRRTKPLESGYDYMQTRGWKTIFDATPMLGQYGAVLSLPIVNDVFREMLSEGFLKPKLAELNDEEYKPFNTTITQAFVNSLGYMGGALEAASDSAEVALKHGEWGKAALSTVATRGISARIFQEFKDTGKKQKQESSGSVGFGM